MFTFFCKSNNVVAYFSFDVVSKLNLRLSFCSRWAIFRLIVLWIMSSSAEYEVAIVCTECFQAFISRLSSVISGSSVIWNTLSFRYNKYRTSIYVPAKHTNTPSKRCIVKVPNVKPCYMIQLKEWLLFSASNNDRPFQEDKHLILS